MKKLLLLTLAIVTLTSLFYCQNAPVKVKNGWESDNLKGKVKSFTESKYDVVDSFGKIQEIEGSLKDKYTLKFDDKGNKIEKNYYNLDGSLRINVIGKFDDKGNNIETKIYNADGSLAQNYTHKNDDNGNRNSYNADGSLYIKETYKYDDKGNQIELNGYNADGSLEDKYTYKYKFDEKGNWIKKISFKNQIPKNIEEREYEYYEY